jgi:uncharacterized protein
MAMECFQKIQQTRTLTGAARRVMNALIFSPFRGPEMLIRLTKPIQITSDSDEPLSDEVIEQLHGLQSEDCCGNYLDFKLADLGITGGHIKLIYDKETKRFTGLTEYHSDVALDDGQLELLARDTKGQWSDGLGEGCFDEQADTHGITIGLCSYEEEDEFQVEQIEDGNTFPAPRTGLAKAARNGDLSGLQQQLDEGKDIEFRLQGYTPLHLAVLYAKPETAMELIKRGADVNAQDPQGSTPLMLAATSNKLKDPEAATLARALLERGADVNGTEFTPLSMAKNRNKKELAAVLQEFGAA